MTTTETLSDIKVMSASNFNNITTTDDSKLYFVEDDTKAYVTSTYHSGSSWYRVWSDNFIEQGGYISSGTATDSRQISLNKTMSTSTYFVICSANVAVTGTGNTTNRAVCRTFGRVISRATNSFNIQCDAGDFYWYACGY